MALKVMQRVILRFKNLAVSRAMAEFKSGYYHVKFLPKAYHASTQVQEDDMRDPDRERIQERLNGMVDLLEQAKGHIHKDSSESLEVEINRLRVEKEKAGALINQLQGRVKNYETEVLYLEQQLSSSGKSKMVLEEELGRIDGDLRDASCQINLSNQATADAQRQVEKLQIQVKKAGKFHGITATAAALRVFCLSWATEAKLLTWQWWSSVTVLRRVLAMEEQLNAAHRQAELILLRTVEETSQRREVATALQELQMVASARQNAQQKGKDLASQIRLSQRLADARQRRVYGMLSHMVFQHGAFLAVARSEQDRSVVGENPPLNQANTAMRPTKDATSGNLFQILDTDGDGVIDRNEWDARFDSIKSVGDSRLKSRTPSPARESKQSVIDGKKESAMDVWGEKLMASIRGDSTRGRSSSPHRRSRGEESPDWSTLVSGKKHRSGSSGLF